MAPLPPPPPPPPRGPAYVPGGAPTRERIIATAYDHAASRWGLGDAGISMAVFFGTSLALAVAMLAATDAETPRGAWLPALIAIPPAIQLGYLVWLARARGRGLAADFRLLFARADIGIGLLTWFVGLIGAGVVAQIIIALTDGALSAAAADVAEDSSDGGGLTIWILLFAFLGATLIPLVEELVYRGLWWSALEKRGMRPVTCWLVTSLVFAVVHLELLRTPVLLVLGLAIGAGRLWTGRIAASIIAHMLINTIGMLALLFEIA